jgi:phage-related protein/predicted XRE-type DNA-binding protein
VQELYWVGNSREIVRSFPPEVRRVIGRALDLAQRGGKDSNAKPLRGFGGAGVLEIVDDHDGDAYRAVYTVRFAQAVYMLHAFQKKSKRGIATPRQEIDLIRRRLPWPRLITGLGIDRKEYHTMTDAEAVEPSSGNVFADLGFDDPEIELVKARLFAKIAEEIAARGWTQRKAAEILGIDQPRVSLLVRGKTGQFSLERLIGFLGALNFDVRLEATPAPTSAKGHLDVAV